MINEKRINEVLEEIRKIEMEQEEIELFTRSLCKDEESHFEDLQHHIYSNNIYLNNEFEDCLEDRHMMNLLEQEHECIKDIHRECSELLNILETENIQIRNKCECDIEDLKNEIHRLGWM